MPQASLDITTREQLDIYMNPQRQRLLREMQVMARPATCKQLADAMGISASSVTHHMKKLETLGLVELDHTELIRGITAKYWRFIPTAVNVRAGARDDLQEEKAFLVDYLHQRTYDALRSYIASHEIEREQKLGLTHGDLRDGFVYLTEKEASELQDQIASFLEAHESPKEGAVPWEFSLMFFPHRQTEQ